MLQQKVIDDQSDVCREQLSALLAGVLGGGFRLDRRPRKRQNAIVSGGAVAVLFHHVAALLHDVDGGGVGRRAADAQFLQSLHKAGLGVARRVFAKTLGGNNGLTGHGLPFGHRGQHVLRGLVLSVFVVCAFEV